MDVCKIKGCDDSNIINKTSKINIEHNKVDQSSIQSYNEDLYVYHDIFDKNGLIFLNKTKVHGGFNDFSVEKVAESIQCPFKDAAKKLCIEYIIDEQQKNYWGMLKLITNTD